MKNNIKVGDKVKNNLSKRIFIVRKIDDDGFFYIDEYDFPQNPEYYTLLEE